MGEIRLDLQLRHAKSCLVEYGEKLRQAELQLEAACAELERYKAGIGAIGKLSTYPSRSKIVFEGNAQISELRGIDSQRVRALITKLEGVNEIASL